MAVYVITILRLNIDTVMLIQRYVIGTRHNCFQLLRGSPIKMSRRHLEVLNGLWDEVAQFHMSYMLLTNIWKKNAVIFYLSEFYNVAAMIQNHTPHPPR